MDLYIRFKIRRGTTPFRESTPSIEEKQREGEIASVSRGLRGAVEEILDSNRKTVANKVEKWFKTIKAGITKGTRTSALLSMIFDGMLLIVIVEVEREATEKAETNTISDE